MRSGLTRDGLGQSAILWLAASGAVLGIVILSSAPQSFAKESTPSTAVVEVFREALAADAKGDREQRDSLLRKALELDPNYELARWYSGQVLYDGKWQDVTDIGRQVRDDPRQSEYRELLSKSDNSAKAHIELARWCQQANLTYEEKWHWLNVLAADPANREALGRLGLRLYKGRYLTSQQLGAQKTASKQAEEDFDRYSKQFAQWITDGARNDAAAQQELCQRVSQLRDVAAIPALLDTFFFDEKAERRIQAKLSSQQADELVARLHAAVVTALNEIPEHQATYSLLGIALYSPNENLAKMAAESLRPRRKTDYMPQLMQALSSPIEAAISVRRSAGGQYIVHEDLIEKQPLSEVNHSRMNKFLTQHYVTFDVQGRVGGGNGRINKIWTEEARDYNNALTQASNTQAAVEAENEFRERNNARVTLILSIVTGEDLGSDPTAWWDSWNHYNELNTPEKLPVYNTTEYNDYSTYSDEYYSQTYERPTRPVRYARPEQPVSRDPRVVGTPTRMRDPRLFGTPGSYSCFVAGTPVWTQAGKVAIETVQVGDLVLSQDPLTGELDYRPVMETSIGPPSPILDLKIENETVSTTRGHRFWIPNYGWQMAKFLKEGNRVLTLGGTADLYAIEQAKDQEAYNLVVGQFHTYFVGEQKILVHDKVCPLPNLAVLPGVDANQAELTSVISTASN